MVHSFDIFDTVLTRVVARPADVFLWVQNTLPMDKSLEWPSTVRNDFVSIRRSAERKARWQSGKEDTGLEEIYRVMAQDHGFSIQVKQGLMAAELNTESLLMRPVHKVCERIRRLSATGEKVVFISDMYLPADFIQGLLQANGIMVEKAQLFISGDVGLRKLTGHLYSHVLNRLDIRPTQLNHFGDNLVSDVLVPWFLGINTDGWLL